VLLTGIREAIEKNYPKAEIEVIDCMEYLNKPINYITVGLYEEFAKRMPKMWGWVYKKSRKGVIAGFSNSINKMLAGKLRKTNRKNKPRLNNISTSIFNTNVCNIKEKRKTEKRSLNSNDRL
jgi:hypothetical protein